MTSPLNALHMKAFGSCKIQVRTLRVKEQHIHLQRVMNILTKT